MKKLVIPLLIIGIIAGSHWFLPAQAQGGDCDLSPEDCAILEAHAAKMLDTTTLAIEDFAFSGLIDLPDPIEFSAQGDGITHFEVKQGTRLLFDILGEGVEETTKQETREILLRRLATLGFANASVQIIGNQLAVEVPLSPLPESFVSDLTARGGILLEFVDFSETPMDVTDGACILTDVQIALGYLNGLCPPENPGIGSNGQPDGPPFHSIMTGDELADTWAEATSFGNWVISFTLTPTGQQIFADYTAQHIGDRLAIVLDGVVISAPTIQNAITGEQGQISGDFSETQANSLAEQLRDKDVLPLKVLLNTTEAGSIFPNLQMLSLNLNPFVCCTSDSRTETNLLLGIFSSNLSISGGSIAMMIIDYDENAITDLWLSLLAADSNLSRIANTKSTDSCAVFPSEIALQSLFSNDFVGRLLAEFLVYLLFNEIDFAAYGLTSGEVVDFLATTLAEFPSDEALQVRRYISLDDYSLRRVELSTSFEFPVHLLSDTLGIPLFEDVNEVSVIQFELQADLDE
ncbi:MAG: hypothetical protein K8L91_19515 [Anaerolineae bacterium]|nr:hypothetical protein [Anaerolineae bacterium]